MYSILFLFGLIGFLAMAGLSFLHSGHDSHTGNHGSTGEALASLRAMKHAQGAKSASGAHAAPTHHPVAAGRGGRLLGRAKAFRPWWMLSPFDIIAYCFGAGAVGEILRQSGQPANIQLIGAILGAIIFNFGLAKPIMNALLKFESRQSAGLEGLVATEAEAVTRFDEQGRGLVRLNLDGQIVQVLGVLDGEEQHRGVKVAKGDSLLVIDVDPARNLCRVTRELAP